MTRLGLPFPRHPLARARLFPHLLPAMLALPATILFPFHLSDTQCEAGSTSSDESEEEDIAIRDRTSFGGGETTYDVVRALQRSLNCTVDCGLGRWGGREGSPIRQGKVSDQGLPEG